MMGLELKYFVLKPNGISVHARASRTAMRAYAEAIRPFNRELADDLISWADFADEQESLVTAHRQGDKNG